MWQQIRSNRIRPAILVTGMAIILLFPGFFIGLAIGSSVMGLIIALLIWGISLFVTADTEHARPASRAYALVR